MKITKKEASLQSITTRLHDSTGVTSYIIEERIAVGCYWVYITRDWMGCVLDKYNFRKIITNPKNPQAQALIILAALGHTS